MDHLDTPPTTTLDPARADQLRTFLTAEAANDVAEPRTQASTHPVRRKVLVGAAAAVLLGGAVFAANAALGGPGTGGAKQAVAIETDDGWTTIRIVDINADPQAVVDQLTAAGIDARLGTFHVARDGDRVTVSEGDDEDALLTMVAVGSVGDDGLAGLTVALPQGVGLPSGPAGGDDGGPTLTTGPEPGTGPAQRVGGNGPDVAAHDVELEKLGFRSGPDGSISIRNGSRLTVVVRVER